MSLDTAAKGSSSFYFNGYGNVPSVIRESTFSNEEGKATYYMYAVDTILLPSDPEVPITSRDKSILSQKGWFSFGAQR